VADRDIIIGRVINVTGMIGVSAGISLQKSVIRNEFGRFAVAVGRFVLAVGTRATDRIDTRANIISI